MQNLQEIFGNYVIFENITRHLFKPAALIKQNKPPFRTFKFSIYKNQKLFQNSDLVHSGLKLKSP